VAADEVVQVALVLDDQDRGHAPRSYARSVTEV
jgi:hypothetical protein